LRDATKAPRFGHAHDHVPFGIRLSYFSQCVGKEFIPEGRSEVTMGFIENLEQQHVRIVLEILGNLSPLCKEALFLPRGIFVQRVVMVHIHNDVEIVCERGIYNLLDSCEKRRLYCVGWCLHAAFRGLPPYGKAHVLKSQLSNHLKVLGIPRVAPGGFGGRFKGVAYVDTSAEPFVHFESGEPVLGRKAGRYEDEHRREYSSDHRGTVLPVNKNSKRFRHSNLSLSNG